MMCTTSSKLAISFQQWRSIQIFWRALWPVKARSSTSTEIPPRVEYLQAKQNVISSRVANVCGVLMIALASPIKRASPRQLHFLMHASLVRGFHRMWVGKSRTFRNAYRFSSLWPILIQMSTEHRPRQTLDHLICLLSELHPCWLKFSFSRFWFSPSASSHPDAATNTVYPPNLSLEHALICTACTRVASSDNFGEYSPLYFQCQAFKRSYDLSSNPSSCQAPLPSPVLLQPSSPLQLQRLLYTPARPRQTQVRPPAGPPVRLQYRSIQLDHVGWPPSS